MGWSGFQRRQAGGCILALQRPRNDEMASNAGLTTGALGGKVDRLVEVSVVAKQP